MANPYFQFKKFTVWHDKCAMKVGTDGVLLGEWASTERCQRILDVGTGTGLIALMLAQRSTAILDAIDIDSDACLQAQENIAKSPFANRIQVYQTSLSEYMPDENIKYDLIVSNPPYFIDSLKCPDTKRNLARHTDTLSLPDLLRGTRRKYRLGASLRATGVFNRHRSRRVFVSIERSPRFPHTGRPS